MPGDIDGINIGTVIGVLARSPISLHHDHLERRTYA
jgi:hypothetical protein